jgi:hypothetical protein
MGSIVKKWLCVKGEIATIYVAIRAGCKSGVKFEIELKLKC